PEIETLLDGAGGVPILRGTVPAFGAIARLAWWEGRRVERLTRGPARPTWPELAVATPSYGYDRAARSAPALHVVATALSERESLELLGAAGLSVVLTEA